MARTAYSQRGGARRAPARPFASATGVGGAWAGIVCVVTGWHPYQVRYLATCPHRHRLARTAVACARRLTPTTTP